MDTLDELGIWDHGRLVLPAHRAPVGELGPTDDEPRRVRRSDVVLRRLGERVLTALRAESKPVAISILARRLGLNVRALAHPLSLLVAAGRAEKRGTRRGTRYSAPLLPPKPSKHDRPKKRKAPRAGLRSARAAIR